MFDPTTLLGFHTIISLIAIATGLPMVLALLGFRMPAIWTEAFLVTAVGTSANGFLLPAAKILPSHIVGALALIVLAAVLFARFVGRFGGAWRWIYAAGMVASLYLLCFVAVEQAFGKIPALEAAAPIVTKPNAQVVALIVFVGLGIAAARLFRRGAAATA